MKFPFSEFGNRIGSSSGIEELMVDLGEALHSGRTDLCMLGGGQPAQIQAVNAVWRRRMEEILANEGELEEILVNYDPPRGNPGFIVALTELLQQEFHWPITEENIAISCGGQTAFFHLFNMLAGNMPDGSKKRILLPLVPEYIGYANQGIAEDSFYTIPPIIEKLSEHEFKYRVDFDNLKIDDSIAAICVSRPTNPTGNVLTDEEIRKLSELAKQHNIPLIIDNAYGAPFPNILFADAAPFWEEHVIYTMSLSKLGLPGTRTGIVVAATQITQSLSAMTSITGLANPNMGQAITLPLIQSREILEISQQAIQPYYLEKSRKAQQWCHETFTDRFDYFIHKSEGALFLWLWFPGLPIPVKELYRRLKKRGTLIIPGHYFFFGLDSSYDNWPHRHECLRMTFTMDESTVRRGIEIIAEEVASAWER